MENDFEDGRKAAREEIKAGDIYDIPAAFLTFKNDPPDSEYIWGYFSQLYDIMEQNK
tara:strand:+ start:5758 stop:5928 length:171 start_codon:yes stop_codon:yes gene_type:complete